MTKSIKFDYVSVPTLREFAASNAFIRGVCGPFGSGKSSACVVEIIRRAQMQKPGPDGIRRTRWAAIRNTFRELDDTTIRTVFQWLPVEYFGKYYINDHRYVVKAFPGVEFEILFRALDTPEDVKKLLSLELTGAWVNEGREVPWSIIDALTGRIGRYPAVMDGGPTWQGLWIDTNPPDADSKFYKFFEERDWLAGFERMAQAGKLPPGVNGPDDYARIFHQPSGLSDKAENIPNLTPGYYQRLAIGKSPEWVKVYVEGKYGFVMDGRPVFAEYNDAVHCKAVEPMAGIPVIRGWDYGLCYDDQTEVLTQTGWKLFADVGQEDMIATRDPKTGEMSYAKSAFKVAKDYDGEMLEWSSTELNLCVTPEHRVPFTYRDSPGKVHWQSAEWLAQHMGGHHYVDLCSTWAGKTASICGMEPMVFAEFMGLYLSEGCTNKGRVTIYQKAQRPDMQRILDATGLKWSWRKGAKACGWRLWHPELAAYLKQFGTAKHKFVPPEIRFAPPQHIRAFIMAYTAGDGHIRTRKGHGVEHTIYTTSKRMADEMQELAQKAAWNSSVRWQKPTQNGVALPDGRRIVGTGGWNITFKKTATRAELLKKNFRRVPYKGKVYCLNVPHHTLYVRRGGKPSWNGNTPVCTFHQMLPDGRWLWFDELISENIDPKGMGIDRFSDNVLDHCARSFPKGVKFEDYGDPAGQQRAQTDEKTVFQVLQAKGIDIEGGEQTLAIRLESVRKPLNSLRGGEPQFILHPRCKVARKGFMGGYHYKRVKAVTGDKFKDEPDKSHPISDVMDSGQYVATRLFGESLVSRNAPDDGGWQGFGTYGMNDAGRSDVTGY